MPAAVLRWKEFAAGRPFHAALAPLSVVRSAASRHTHADFHELVYVLSGSGSQHLPDGPQPIRAGDLLLVRPSDVHDFTADAAGCELINVAFASERWRAFLDYAQVPAAAGWEASARPVLAAAEPEVGRGMLRSLQDFQATPRWVDLIRLWTTVVPALESALTAPDDRPPWLRRACAAMLEEDNLIAGLPRLRRLAAVSDGHLARSVGTWLGCSPVEFVNRVRLDHAAVLLATGTAPVGAVAGRSGFTSHAYFCRRFQDRFGTTPSDYRSQARRAVVP